MSPKDALRLSIGMSEYIVNAYINDLDDAELLIRPVPGMNHIAWQLGHLIASERNFVEMVPLSDHPFSVRPRRGTHNTQKGETLRQRGQIQRRPLAYSRNLYGNDKMCFKRTAKMGTHARSL